MNGKNLVISMLFSAVLLALAFSPMTGSQTTHEYDPWADMNDDGMIRIDDVYYVASKFGANGEPVNKTALLYEVNMTFTELLAKIDELNTTFLTKIDELNTTLLEYEMRLASLEDKIETLGIMVNDLNASLHALNDTDSELKSQIAYLNASVYALNATDSELKSQIAYLETLINLVNDTKLGKPDYDSGWVPISPGESLNFTHNLGTTKLLVYVIGWSPDYLVHQIDYGGEKLAWGTDNHGIIWYNLNTETITVHRYPQDGNWELVRVIIWKIPS